MEQLINIIIWAAIVQGYLLGILFITSKEYSSWSNKLLGFFLLSLLFELVPIICSLFTIPGYGQVEGYNSSHLLGFGLQYHQIKEAANYGFVNQGLNITLNYSFEKLASNHLFAYSPIIAFGPNYRNGLGLNWHFRLIDFYYGFGICKKETRKLYLGPYTSINYLLELYPEMQSGHMYWFTAMELGPKLHLFISIGDRRINIKVSNSVIGFTSRPPDVTEQYFYSLNIGDIIEDSHSSLQLGSLETFNHSFLEINYANPSRNKLTLGYVFEYLGYYDTPTFYYLTHSILLKWQLGK